MYDLIYADSKVEELIKRQFPSATTKDARDYIHTERFECEVNVPEDEFYIFAIRQDFAECCFGFNLMMRDCPEGARQKVWDWLAEAEALEESELERR